jgi:TPR repeat protein
MTRLGMLYHNALGVERDTQAAVKWWKEGAERGDADGQAMLGAAYHLGAGAPKDRVAAFAWLLRAKAGGSPLAMRFYDVACAELSPDELAEAERRAAEPLPETDA